MIYSPCNKLELETTIENSKRSLIKLKNKNIFISGATGFFGKWLMQTLILANNNLNLNLQIIIITRNKIKSLEEQPWLKSNFVQIIEGDISNFIFPSIRLDIIIHAATEASAKLNEFSPEAMANTIIDGTRNILKLAKLSNCPNFLFISSGAVYGSQPSNIFKTDEKLQNGPDISNVYNAYAESKRMAELYCQIAKNKNEINLKIARCYAFVGPYLPLDQHFAIGNFIKNILDQEPIRLTGDGSPYRSYMYPTDLIEWLLTILISGDNGEVYNVGSDQEIQLLELANIMNNMRPKFNLEISDNRIYFNQKKNLDTSRNTYVPSIDKCKNNLNLKIRIKLEKAIENNINWLLESKK